MSETEVIDTMENYRVRVERDECPSEPENEAGFPVFYLSYRNGSVAFTGYGDDVIDGSAILEQLVDRYGTSDGMLMFERWLSIWHDGKVIQRNDVDRDGTILAYTCRELAEKWGIPAEYNVPNADEWCAYVEGDVWGILVEERVLAHHNARTHDGTPVYDYDAEEWRVVDDVWGYYGREYAEEEARGSLAPYRKA